MGCVSKTVIPLADRFLSKVDTNGPIPERCPQLGRCHIWLGSRNWDGYGMIQTGSRRDGSRRARRATHVALELAGRPLRSGMKALHRCDVPYCVNVDHLFEGTQRDNVRDM